jgi:hypothetical protein
MSSTARSIEDLYRMFPDYPQLKVLRTDVLREGIRLTPNLYELGLWSVPQNLYVFEADHLAHLSQLETASDSDKLKAVSKGWVNSPNGFRLKDDFLIQIGFNPKSPYEIVGSGKEGDEHTLHRNGKPLEPIRFDKRPRWMDQKTSDGVPMANVIQIQGKGALDGLLIRHCEYFNTNDSCRFCSIDIAIPEMESESRFMRFLQSVMVSIPGGTRLLYTGSTRPRRPGHARLQHGLPGHNEPLDIGTTEAEESTQRGLAANGPPGGVRTSQARGVEEAR